MLPRPEPAATVLLTGVDAAAVKALEPAAEVLMEFGITVETAVVSDGGLNAARFVDSCAIIVASPDGGLPSEIALATKLPVIRVPTESKEKRGAGLLGDENGNLPSGADEGVFATMAIGVAGAKNAALFVVAVLALKDEGIRLEYAKFRADQTTAVLNHPPLEL